MPVSKTGDHLVRIGETLADRDLQTAIFTATGRLKTSRRDSVSGRSVFPDYQDLRAKANQIKRHAIENLDYYLEQVEANVTARGGKVIFAETGAEVSRFIIDLAKERGAKLLVKSKSMTTEEVDLNEHLEHAQLEPVETDLGEYIIQLAHDRPYHIVAPALHMTRYQVADLFTEKLGIERETVVEKQTMIARARLRQKFLAADNRRQRRETLWWRIQALSWWWRTKATRGSRRPRRGFTSRSPASRR